MLKAARLIRKHMIDAVQSTRILDCEFRNHPSAHRTRFEDRRKNVTKPNRVSRPCNTGLPFPEINENLFNPKVRLVVLHVSTPVRYYLFFHNVVGTVLE
jgi:hypothetical protein